MKNIEKIAVGIVLVAGIGFVNYGYTAKADTIKEIKKNVIYQMAGAALVGGSVSYLLFANKKNYDRKE